MKSSAFGAVLVCLPLVYSVSAADVRWKGGSADYTVGASWSNGAAPTAGDKVYFHLAADSGTNTVFLGDDVSTAISQINFYTGSNACLAFDGRGHSFLMPEVSAGGTYEKEQIRFYDPGYNHVFAVSGYGIADCTNAAPWRADDPYFVYALTPAGGTSLVFSRGDYDFHAPDGVAYPNRILSIGSSETRPSIHTAFENCTAEFPRIQCVARAATNTLRFADGTYVVHGNVTGNDQTHFFKGCRRFAVDIDGADVTFAGAIALYPNAATSESALHADREFRFDVRNGARLVTSNQVCFYRGTNATVTVRDSTWIAMGADSAGSQGLGIGYYADEWVHATHYRLIAENSVFDAGRQHNYGNIGFGREYSATHKTSAEAYFTNCTITSRGSFNFNRARGVFKDCTFDGNKTGQDYSLVIQSDSDVTIDGGTFTNIGGPRMNATAYSEKGPLLRILGGVVGNDAHNNYSGIGWGSTAAPVGVTNVIQVKGGVFNQRWISLSSGNGGQPARVELSGGELSAKAVYGGSGRRAAQPAKNGWAHFVGDGGVYRIPELESYRPSTWPSGWPNTQPIFYNLDALEATANGLIVDTNGRDPFMYQGVSDYPGVRGRFVKRGTGTLKVNALTPWTVSETVVEAGTFLVLTNRASTAVAFETALVLRPGTVLSTEGETESLTLDALAVTNATLLLDPGDVITVKGPLSLDALHVEFTTAPALGEGLDFLVCETPLSAENVRSLRAAVLAHAIADGTYADLAAREGEDGRFTVRLTVKESPAVSGETAWQGPGVSWNETANWSAGLPSASDVAVFDSAAAPTSVSLDADAETGALLFGAGAFTLAGDGVLSFAAPGNSRLSVTGGAQTVAVDLAAFVPLPVEVGADASLTLTGRTSGRGIVKRGSGRLDLEGPVDGSVESAGGRLVSGPAGLAAADEVRLGDGTLEVPEGASVGDVSFRLVSTNKTSAVVLDNAADVTATGFFAESGAFVKRGKGRFTIDAATGACSGLAAGQGGHDDGNMIANASIFPFPDDGTPPAFGYGGFSVAGGELVVRGDGQTKVHCRGAIHIGLRTSTHCGAQPSLTLDGIDFDSQTGGLYWHTVVGLHTADTGNFTTNPVLRVINGSVFRTCGLYMGYAYSNDKKRTGAELAVAVTNSTVESSGLIGLSQLRGSAGVARLLVSNATLKATYFDFSGNTDSRLTAATLTGVSGGYGKISGDCYGAGSVLFDGGTLLKISTFTFLNSNLQYGKPLTFAFDDAVWDAGPDGLTLDTETLTGYLSLRRFEMRGKGLTLPVADGATFRSDAVFSGDGDLVKTGSGTLAFGSGAFAVEGTTRVQEGVLDLSAAGTVTNACFAGAGTVRGATFGTGVRIDPEIGAGWTTGDLPLFENCTFASGATVTVDPSVAAGLDLPSPDGIAVARCTGTVPDVSRWRVVRDWPVPGVSARFTVDGGTVRMTVVRTGFTLIVR